MDVASRRLCRRCRVPVRHGAIEESRCRLAHRSCKASHRRLRASHHSGLRSFRVLRPTEGAHFAHRDRSLFDAGVGEPDGLDGSGRTDQRENDDRLVLGDRGFDGIDLAIGGRRRSARSRPRTRLGVELGGRHRLRPLGAGQGRRDDDGVAARRVRRRHGGMPCGLRRLSACLAAQPAGDPVLGVSWAGRNRGGLPAVVRHRQPAARRDRLARRPVRAGDIRSRLGPAAGGKADGGGRHRLHAHFRRRGVRAAAGEAAVSSPAARLCLQLTAPRSARPSSRCRPGSSAAA